MRCDGSPHGFRAVAATLSGGRNSGSWESGVGVPVPEFTVFCVTTCQRVPLAPVVSVRSWQ
ncbi:hypothetical protein PAXRUDRAFT_836483 [Paxillus rubicundulus Ve08.2h10]|uniref:Uncharacterized protein n=1 Tax=Paxillus rubicundulus Ve08.2h10 TaxID=930991 RepID=A0A0D0D620_9AGAM|nr:hypothetical protein PAXRUDRAFT_836483 [Paxillus rubicundulus Ve08.2h10]